MSFNVLSWGSWRLQESEPLFYCGAYHWAGQARINWEYQTDAECGEQCMKVAGNDRIEKETHDIMSWVCASPREFTG